MLGHHLHSVQLVLLCLVNVPVKTCLSYVMMASKNGSYRRWKALKCECGVIGSDANDLLKPYNRKIGPDPATLATALVGGILNNNSSGMCCGTAQNSYKTIRSIRVVLLDGSVLDTSGQKIY